MDQPIMSLSDIDLSPGFVTQLSVTPTLHETTDQGKKLGKKIFVIGYWKEKLNAFPHPSRDIQFIFTARWRFTPEERGCYFEGEISMKYLPSPKDGGMYR